MYDVHDWHEVHALAEAGVSRTRIAEKLGMSRNTVSRLLALEEPPAYERRPVGSKLSIDVEDALRFVEEVAGG